MNVSQRILVTGASGFLGQGLCEHAVRLGLAVTGAQRSHGEVPRGVQSVVVGEINGATDWSNALRNVDTVIHLAARVHVMHDDAADPIEEFRRINVAGTENLARSAAACGVRRLVYVSSIKVNGEQTAPIAKSAPFATTKKPLQNAFTEADVPCPQDPYGISKWEAELILHRVATETGMEIVIVRPPLVYGPGVKGNFAQMLKVLAKRIPLPLASVCNLRSLVYIENLVDALILCAAHPAAAGQTYLVSDGEDISTSGLLARLGDAMSRPARLFPCPPGLLRLAGRLAGKQDQVERLLESLQVDSGKIRRELNWIPPFTLQQGLQKTAEWYRNAHL